MIAGSLGLAPMKTLEDGLTRRGDVFRHGDDVLMALVLQDDSPNSAPKFSQQCETQDTGIPRVDRNLNDGFRAVCSKAIADFGWQISHSFG